MMAMAVGLPAEELNETNVIEWRELVGTTRCFRCGGLMVPEQCFDLRSDNGQLDFTAKRCVQCGELVDPVILKNRRLRPLGDFGKGERGSRSSEC